MHRYQKDVALLAIAMCLLISGIYFLFGSSSHPQKIKLKMTAGDGSGLRHRLATEFSREAAKSGIQISVEPTEGSEAALKRLSLYEFDIALVQGGLTSHMESPIRQLSALHIEPLHLLVKPQLKREISEKGLTQLAGHELNLGARESGTHSLATGVLRFAGLRPSPGAPLAP